MNHGVASVISALTAHDNVGGGREHIDNFALPFVAPLRAN
jgi:hypothetical protein